LPHATRGYLSVLPPRLNKTTQEPKMTRRFRGTIIKTPDGSPGMLAVNGRQMTFTLDGIRKSAVAPAVNMAVDIEFDDAGHPQQAAKEKLQQVGNLAQVRGREAANIARQGVGALAARMGKAALAATVVLWIAWFCMPGLILSFSVIGLERSRSITFWDALALDPYNNMNPGSHGFLSLVVLACHCGALRRSVHSAPARAVPVCGPAGVPGGGLVHRPTRARPGVRRAAAAVRRRRRCRRLHVCRPATGPGSSRWRALPLPRSCSSTRRATTPLPNRANGDSYSYGGPLLHELRKARERWREILHQLQSPARLGSSYLKFDGRGNLYAQPIKN
jgi:hypothetical protein